MSHTDDNAQAGAGSASGPGPRGSVSRRAFAGGLAGAAGLGLAACSSGLKGGSATSTGTIKIGWIHPITGGLAGFGHPDAWVWQKVSQTSAFKNGIKIGSKTYKIDFTSYDTQSSPTRAGDLAKQAILTDKVDLLLASSTPETVNTVTSQAVAAMPQNQVVTYNGKQTTVAIGVPTPFIVNTLLPLPTLPSVSLPQLPKVNVPAPSGGHGHRVAGEGQRPNLQRPVASDTCRGLAHVAMLRSPRCALVSTT